MKLTDEMIQAAAIKHGIPVALVRAMIQVESGGNTWAIRFEPGYPYLWPAGVKAENLTPTELNQQRFSYGLLQVMGAVARERGLKGYCTQLCDPEIGLEYGCQHLAGYYAKYKDWDKAIVSYNAGSPRIGPAGEYVNQGYLDKVKMLWLGKVVVD